MPPLNCSFYPLLLLLLWPRPRAGGFLSAFRFFSLSTLHLSTSNFISPTPPPPLLYLLPPKTGNKIPGSS